MNLDVRSLLDHARLISLYQRATQMHALEGDFAELGVYRGGVLRLLSEACPHKAVHGFDTFAGIPDRVEKPVDDHDAGDFGDTSCEAVAGYLSDRPRVELHVGRFPETTSGLGHLTFSLVHLDADIYASTKAGIEWFWPRLTPGGVMIFDDWHWWRCEGVLRAVHEFFDDKEDRVIMCDDVQWQLTVVKKQESRGDHG